jgi:3-hydroxyisobutyrate dehydrogenase
MSEIKRIGFIGMGNMGVPMAANLVRGGYGITAYDIAPDRAQRFAREHNAHAATGLAALGPSADLLITMLPSGHEVRQVLLEADGGALAKGLRPGTLAIDMSSSAPVGTRELGRELAARQIALVDAPVSGGVPRATDGTLAIMIGGDAGAVAAMIDVINVSTGRSFPTDLMMKQHVLSGNFATGFALGLLAKDIGIAADLAAQVGADAPIVRMISEMWAQARDGLGGDCDHSRAAAYWERSATSM